MRPKPRANESYNVCRSVTARPTGQLPPPALLAPLSVILASGGDDRLQVAADTGQNMYGCEPRPRRSVLNFASSTATSVSEHAYTCTSQARAELLNQSQLVGLDDAFGARIEGMKHAIKIILGVNAPGADIVLSPSGTDATLHALFLALNLLGTPLTNILVGADETGSGVALAASGRHFSSRTALGAIVEKGSSALDVEAPILTWAIPLRNVAGQPVSAEAIDRAVVVAVEQAIAGGRKVLLHAMDCSKTGARAPSDSCLDYVASTWPLSVQIVIDACQARLTTTRLQRYLVLGCLVLITGSKFFTGPPFSGALLVPQHLCDGMTGLYPAANGLHRYTARTSWPISWQGVRSVLPTAMNFGEWLRWEAALDEMRAYYAVPEAFRAASIHAFGAAIRSLPNYSCLELLPDAGGAAPSERSIFPFLLRRDGRALSLAESKGFYYALNEDLSAVPNVDSGELRSAAARLCHIGQPVALNDERGEPTAALRISAGARLVSHSWVAGDEMLSRRNLERELNKIGAVVEKIEFLMSRPDLWKCGLRPA